MAEGILCWGQLDYVYWTGTTDCGSLQTPIYFSYYL